MRGSFTAVAFSLRRSVIVYLWAIGTIAWLIHVGQNVIRRGGVLFDVSAAEALAILVNTAVDSAWPPLISAVFLTPIIGIECWYRARRNHP